MTNNKMNKRLMRLGSLLLCFTLILPMFVFSAHAEATAFAGGSGTQADPYLIETKEQLNNVRNYLDAHFKLISDIEFTAADFASDGAFYNDGKGWAPIGDSYVNKFTGVFDGNGHVIKNLKINYINVDDYDTICYGTFGYIENATVKNLGIIDSHIEVVTASSTVGAIAGYMNNSTIENCYSTGKVSSYFSVGGIVGSGSGTISSCYNACEVSGAMAHNGGIAGHFAGTVKECYNIGNVHGVSYTAGGIVGELSSGTVLNCYNNGEIKIDDSDFDAYAGGIVGCGYDSMVTACYNIGNVTAMDSSDHAGGIIGFIDNHYNITTANCYYSDSVSRGVGNKETSNCKKSTIDAMKKKATFEGFDFEKVWFINTNGEYLFPQLRNNSTDIPERTLTSISVTKPTKLTYLEGESFDTKGMNVTANYDNGDSEKVTGYTVSGFNSTTGKKTITVSYNGKTATFTVTVEAKPASSEAQSEPPVSSTEPPASSETGSSEADSSETPDNSSAVDNLSSEINSSELESSIVNDENNNIFNSAWLYVIVAISVVIGVTVGIVLKKKK